MPALLVDHLTAKLVDRLTAMLVNRLTAKLLNRLTAKLMVHNSVKIKMIIYQKLHALKTWELKFWLMFMIFTIFWQNTW